MWFCFPFWYLAPRSRPLSEAMLSNHYYDKSELLNPVGFAGGSKGDEADDCLLNLPFRPANSHSRPTSVGIYSNDDEDGEEDSSLYEAVDRHKRKLEEVDILPPPPPPPLQPLITPTATQKDVEMVSAFTPFRQVIGAPIINVTNVWRVNAPKWS